MLNIDRLTARRQTQSGSLEVRGLARLVSLLIDEAGTVDYKLEFARESGRQIIRGEFQGKVWMRCQRCLAPVQVTLRGDVGLERLMDEAQAQQTDLDPLILAQDQDLALAELLEDELILALPVVALHDDADCHARLADDAAQAEPQERRTLPFADLRDLLNKN